jgi:hypothetical protein
MRISTLCQNVCYNKSDNIYLCCTVSYVMCRCCGSHFTLHVVAAIIKWSCLSFIIIIIIIIIRYHFMHGINDFTTETNNVSRVYNVGILKLPCMAYVLLFPKLSAFTLVLSEVWYYYYYYFNILNVATFFIKFVRHSLLFSSGRNVARPLFGQRPYFLLWLTYSVNIVEFHIGGGGGGGSQPRLWRKGVSNKNVNTQCTLKPEKSAFKRVLSFIKYNCWGLFETNCVSWVSDCVSVTH